MGARVLGCSRHPAARAGAHCWLPGAETRPVFPVRYGPFPVQCGDSRRETDAEKCRKYNENSLRHREAQTRGFPALGVVTAVTSGRSGCPDEMARPYRDLMPATICRASGRVSRDVSMNIWVCFLGLVPNWYGCDHWRT